MPNPHARTVALPFVDSLLHVDLPRPPTSTPSDVAARRSGLTVDAVPSYCPHSTPTRAPMVTSSSSISLTSMKSLKDIFLWRERMHRHLKWLNKPAIKSIEIPVEMQLEDDRIGNAMLTESTKINQQGITRIQASHHIQTQGSGICGLGMVTGSSLWYRQDRCGYHLGNMELPITKVGGTTRLKETR